MSKESEVALSEARRMLAARAWLPATLGPGIAWNCLNDEQAIAVINALDERDRLRAAANKAHADYVTLTSQYGLGEPLSDLQAALEPEDAALLDRFYESMGELRDAALRGQTNNPTEGSRS